MSGDEPQRFPAVDPVAAGAASSVPTAPLPEEPTFKTAEEWFQSVVADQKARFAAATTVVGAISKPGVTTDPAPNEIASCSACGLGKIGLGDAANARGEDDRAWTENAGLSDRVRSIKASAVSAGAGDSLDDPALRKLECSDHHSRERCAPNELWGRDVAIPNVVVLALLGVASAALLNASQGAFPFW